MKEICYGLLALCVVVPCSGVVERKIVTATECACDSAGACSLYTNLNYTDQDACQAVVIENSFFQSDFATVRIAISTTSTTCIPDAGTTPSYYTFPEDACTSTATLASFELLRYTNNTCSNESLLTQTTVHSTNPPSCFVADVIFPNENIPDDDDDGEGKWTTRFIVIICLTPLVTGFIGYGTNVIAIKMIFRPYNPVGGFSCGLCGKNAKNEVRCAWRGFQGVFPKRQYSLAQQIGDMVNKNLISAEEMVGQMQKQIGINVDEPEAESPLDADLADGVGDAVSKMLDNKAKTPGFPMFLKAMGGKDKFCDALTRGTVISFKKNIPFLMTTFGMSKKVGNKHKNKSIPKFISLRVRCVQNPSSDRCLSKLQKKKNSEDYIGY